MRSLLKVGLVFVVALVASSVLADTHTYEECVAKRQISLNRDTWICNYWVPSANAAVSAMETMRTGAETARDGGGPQACWQCNDCYGCEEYDDGQEDDMLAGMGYQTGEDRYDDFELHLAAGNVLLNLGEDYYDEAYAQYELADAATSDSLGGFLDCTLDADAATFDYQSAKNFWNTP
jgi:hypothetical protein